MTYDDYRLSIKDADVGYVLTDRAVAPWNLEHVKLTNCSLQFGQHGGGSVADGIVRPGVVVILFKTGPSPEPVWLDGHHVQDSDFCVLGPNSRFVFRCRGPRNWLGISVRVKAPGVNRLWDDMIGKNVILPSIPGEQEHVLAVASAIRDASEKGVWPEGVSGMEANLIRDAQNLLRRASLTQHTRCKPNEARMLEVVYAALTHSRRSSEIPIRIDTICLNTGVSDRTMLRSFNRILGLGTKRYFQLRALNLIRSALREAVAEDRTVTDILMEHGVNELGRAAGQYRRLFGELPSETLRLARLHQTNSDREAPTGV